MILGIFQFITFFISKCCVIVSVSSICYIASEMEVRVVSDQVC